MSSFPGLGWASNMPSFQLGEKTLRIPMTLHKSARLKVVESLKEKSFSGFVLLSGGEEALRYDSDHELLFRYYEKGLHMS